MKNLMLTTALAMMAAPAFSADTKIILECEVIPVENSNYYVKTDPDCDFAGGMAGGKSINFGVFALLPDDDAPVDPVDPEEPVDPVDPEEPVDPVDPEEPTDPVDPPNEEEPTDPVDPPTDPVDPPTDPVDPPADDGDNGHGNDPGGVDPSNPGQGGFDGVTPGW